MHEIPRLIVAGTHSGCGKTTVAMGLMGALRRRGIEVQPFKVGPDFIDPTHHTAVCGRQSRNLDPYMMGEDGVLETFMRASEGAGMAIIEGVMGLFDGVDGGTMASTAHVARILRAPVLLVVDALGMSGSVHALVKGFSEYDPAITIAGVIYNQVGSERHRRMIEQGRPASSPRALGWLPKRRDLEIPSRHLGLHLAGERPGVTVTGNIIAEHCDIEGIIEIAGRAPPLECAMPGNEAEEDAGVRIGIAFDSAFCFYYRDNLERLEAQGAEIVFFSPLAGEMPEVSAIYLGGGYPELHAGTLIESRFTEVLRRMADDGMPVYGECGGLLVLSEALVAEREYRMSGVLPAIACMTERLQALDYVQACVVRDAGVFRRGAGYRGHEFHYSRVEPHGDARCAIHLARGKGITGDGRDGLVVQQTLGCYTHAYFNEDLAASIVEAAGMYARR